MEAIICNAGAGSRLGEYGRQVKKCLIKDINFDKSILWYQLDALSVLGVDSVYVVVTKGDKQIPVEVHRIQDRFPKMKIQCVTGKTDSFLDSVATGVAYTKADQILRLDGDVCVMNSTDLLGLRGLVGNYICCYRLPLEKMNTSVPVVADGHLKFWEAEGDPTLVWACIDLWDRESLQKIVEDKSDNGGYVLTRINKAIDSGMKINMIDIPSVYEVDTLNDVNILKNEWNKNAKNIELKCNKLWEHQIQYPKFKEDKDKRLEIDKNIVFEFCDSVNTVVNIGVGVGKLDEAVLNRQRFFKYTLVEPNRYWRNDLLDKFSKYSEALVESKTFEEFVSKSNYSELAIMFGVIMYCITDQGLVDCLSKLNAKTILIKASEPKQEKYDRLLVNEYSDALGSDYIALYRNANDVCKVLRQAGWKVSEVRRNIYPKQLDSSFGNSTFLIVANRA